MTRLLLFVMMILGFALAFAARSPGLLGVGLLLGVCGFFGLIFAFASARVSASARPETSMASVEDIAAFRKRSHMPPRTPPAKLPPHDRADNADRAV